MGQRTVLISGASTGIGRATALLLADSGFTVYAGVRRDEDGELLRAASSGDIRPLRLDVTDAAQIAEARKTLNRDLGGAGLTGLVNNAGIAAAAPLELVPLEAVRHQLEVNVVGQLGVIQSMIPLLRAARGRVVNITSIGGLIAGPVLGPYYASKFALEALTHTLRIELSDWGIEVIAIEPGAIATPIWGTASARTTGLLSELPPAMTELYDKRIDTTLAFAADAAVNGLPPVEVARVIHRALTARRPRTRYTVGRDAAIGANVLARLPDRLRDRLLSGERPINRRRTAPS